MQERINSRNFETQRHAIDRIPGMTQLLSKRPDQFAMGVWPGYYSKAKGAEIWDLDGNRYVDMSIAGIGANLLGYADPDVDDRVVEAIRSGSSSSLNCAEEVELAEELCRIHPWADMVRYARSGGEAMVVAVRLARAATGRDIVAFCGYHGWHDWYLAANLGTENALGTHLLPGLEPAGVPEGLSGTAIPFNYNRIEELSGIADEHGASIAAIVLEPTRGEEPADGFLEGVRRIADKIGAALIVDEISAGFRINVGGAHLSLGLEPDIAVFSKALGNGYPIAAVIGRRETMEAAQRSFVSSTNWTERVGPVAALAAIEKIIETDTPAKVSAMGRTVQEMWRTQADRHGLAVHVGGMPAMSHLDFEHPENASIKSYFTQLMLDHGILAGGRFYAMLAHTDEHIEAYGEATGKCFVEIADALSTGTLSDRMRAQPVAPGFTRIA